MDGKMGHCPDYYPLIRAARYLGVPPWELADRPRVWLEWALTCKAAEDGARAARMRIDIGQTGDD